MKHAILLLANLLSLPLLSLPADLPCAHDKVMRKTSFTTRCNSWESATLRLWAAYNICRECRCGTTRHAYLPVCTHARPAIGGIARACHTCPAIGRISEILHAWLDQQLARPFTTNAPELMFYFSSIWNSIFQQC